ncbi:ESX secretion-associated protein EspG [Labedaea rhizosphaerae]|uniref:ESAT-6 protein secretion system EspG family protein n=1 Tax=Labedaea rhizosphaerae TaxID=598644 RepID=A0A4R6SKZ3_LABRH|nr:ESX secretion-associated protein EspG [Labedaea rhizosphaerae]TDQ05126.1 ESAT-6 protein secretion system EspG family protein [Labedaea rhizosphaerae]
MRVALDATEFDVVWRAAGLGVPPAVLDMPSPGGSHAERARIEHAVWSALTGRGLATGFGQATSRLRTAIGLVASRVTSFELHTARLRALLGRVNQRAVLVEFADGRLLLRTVPDTGLAQTIAGLLPELPAGPGRSITVDVGLLAKAEAAASRRVVLRRGGLSRDDARTLADMMCGADGHGQIVAEVTHHGVTRRSASVVAFFHNDGGRYRVIRTDDHVTITPVTTAQLAAAADELLSELR